MGPAERRAQPAGGPARRREARAVAGGRWSTVSPWGSTDDDADVLRAALDAVRPWADQLQTAAEAVLTGRTLRRLR